MALYNGHRGVVPACVLTIILGFCATAWSARYGGGTGTPDDPYQIWTPEQMNAIGADPNDWSSHFKLMADIDLSAYEGTGFNVIGYKPKPAGGKLRQISIAAGTSPFTGIFDGDGHTISGFYYSCDSGSDIGLFGYVDDPNAEIKNVGLAAPHVDAGTGQSVGSLVGTLQRGKIISCHIEGANIAGQMDVGGLVGYAYDAVMMNCSSGGTIRGSKNTGGLIGEGGRTVTNCCSSAMVIGNDHCGGLTGSGGVIKNCYATGTVIGTTYVGGLVGEGGTITHCYATGVVIGGKYTGGLVGYGYGHPYDDKPVGSFWDIKTSGQETSSGGSGKPTAQMQTIATFLKAGWDFVGETANGTEDVWWMVEGQSYPRLSWEMSAGQVVSAIKLSNLLAGTGTEQDPFLIGTAEELNLIGLFPEEWDKHFKLMADIDLRAYRSGDFNIIGQIDDADKEPDKAFCGVFDGNNHTISNLTLSLDVTWPVGLFGFVNNPRVPSAGQGLRSASNPQAQIRNLGLISPRIEARAGDSVGALVGSCWDGLITNCYVRGGIVAGRDMIGGLVGYDGLATIDSCFSTAMVIGKNGIGGLVGYQQSGVVTNSYASGMVIGDSGVGGLVGQSFGWRIACCYSAGTVIAEKYVGGLLGSGRSIIVEASFWDVDTSGQTSSHWGLAKITSEMQAAEAFLDAGWDFVGETANGTADIWWIDDGKDYPRLWWEAMAEPNSPAGGGKP